MKKILLFLVVLLDLTVDAQQPYYSPPIKIPLLLSGSFAELRSNHFHSGIDIKTKGTTGFPVYAVAEGYISRISVSPTGFGRALYITHPNGTTTVYAHLQSFKSEIEKYIRDKQYEKKSFRINLQLPKYLFPVSKDEEIAKSGNTGSSGGPHLHFEIRDTQSEEPLNPLKYNFPVTDHIAPKIFSLLVVPLSDESHVDFSSTPKSYPVVFYDDKYHLKNNPTIPIWGKIGVAIQTNDYFDGSYNKCGINLLRMTVNNQTFFTFQLNRFAFHNSRYINSHIVYSEFIKSKRRFIKTWHEPGNKLPVYNHNGSEGIICPAEEQLQNVEIELQDTYGNNSILTFSTKGVFKMMKNGKNKTSSHFYYDRLNTFENGNLKVSIPKGALYNDIDFEYHTEPSSDKYYTDYHFIHKKNVPLHTNASIKIKVDSLPAELQTKALIVNVDTATGKYHAAGGEYNNGWMETQTNTLGIYSVVADTLVPSITPLSIKGNVLTETNCIRFKIIDELSGIKTIEGLLDGQWALFEYDPKTSRITHYFDKTRFEFDKWHSLKLIITDQRKNSAIYEATFWK